MVIIIEGLEMRVVMGVKICTPLSESEKDEGLIKH